MTDLPCPVSFSDLVGAMLRGEFRPMTDMDLEGFCGIVFTGWIIDDLAIDDATGEFVVVVDHGPKGIMFNVVDVEHGTTWALEATGSLEQIGG